MTAAAPLTADLSTRPDPRQDRDGQGLPGRIAAMLVIVRILAEYGRHLAETLEQRSVLRGFATIAQYFGTPAVPVILAHINRGLLRAVALERMLLMRARSGCDLSVLAPRPHAPRKPPAAGQPPDGTPTAEQASAPPETAAAPVSRRRSGRNTPPMGDARPSVRQIDAEVRRRAPGQSIVDICLDFGVSPGLCAGPFWNQVFTAIHWYRGSFNVIMGELRRRQKQLDKEGWKYPTLGLPEETREGCRQVLGFFIGETPVVPCQIAEPPHVPRHADEQPAAPCRAQSPEAAVVAVATGPPGGS